MTMKQELHVSVVFGTLLAMWLCLGSVAIAQQAADLEITTAAICREVVEREPVDADTSFEPTVGKVSCFTHVMGAQGPTVIYHIWSFGERERAVVELPVNSVSWRTHSSKIIQPHEIGDWRVQVLGPEGDELKLLHFEIKSQSEVAAPEAAPAQ
ncbi:MAG TPA: DUF2914 domain-containing protein [Desulfobacterales bacterium]|nr:DUF2914 domain-containing protein [Desulfobacterales bacterium]